MMSHHFLGRGARVMKPIHHLKISHHPDDTKFKICCQYSKTLNNILNQLLKHDAHSSPMEMGAMVSHHFQGGPQT